MHATGMILTGSSEISGSRAEPTAAAYISGALALAKATPRMGGGADRGCNWRAHCVVRGGRETTERTWNEPVAAPGRRRGGGLARGSADEPDGETRTTAGGGGEARKGEAAPR